MQTVDRMKPKWNNKTMKEVQRLLVTWVPLSVKVIGTIGTSGPVTHLLLLAITAALRLQSGLKWEKFHKFISQPTVEGSLGTQHAVIHVPSTFFFSLFCPSMCLRLRNWLIDRIRPRQNKTPLSVSCQICTEAIGWKWFSYSSVAGLASPSVSSCRSSLRRFSGDEMKWFGKKKQTNMHVEHKAFQEDMGLFCELNKGPTICKITETILFLLLLLEDFWDSSLCDVIKGTLIRPSLMWIPYPQQGDDRTVFVQSITVLAGGCNCCLFLNVFKVFWQINCVTLLQRSPWCQTKIGRWVEQGLQHWQSCGGGIQPMPRG